MEGVSSVLSLLVAFTLGIFSARLMSRLHVEVEGVFCKGAPPIQMTKIDVDPTNGDTKEWKLIDTSHDEVKILCIILTSPGQAAHVKKTWSKRCNVNLFLGPEENKNIPIVGINTTSDPTVAAMEALEHARKFYMEEADWFLMADTETYIILENLRDFLKDKDYRDPVCYGRSVAKNEKPYLGMEAGFVLSKAAVERFVSSTNATIERKREVSDIGSILQNAGIRAGISRDSDSRELFHFGDVAYHASLAAFQENTTTKDELHPNCEGLNCTTSHPIAFHDVSLDELYVLEYGFYRARVTGRCTGGYKI